MHASPFIVNAEFTVNRAFELFRSLGLRHLLVNNNEGKIQGLLTRKDFILVYSHGHHQKWYNT
jgi:chloride channel 7